MSQDWRMRFPALRDPGIAAAGVVLLMCGPALPGLSRIVVLPALLIAPGYAFLRLIGEDRDWRSASLTVPVSLVLIAFAVLLLDVAGIRLDPPSLGSVIGSVTALFMAGSYGRRLAVRPVPRHRRRLPPDELETYRNEPTVSERG